MDKRVEAVDLYLRSRNEVKPDRASIKREEWDSVLAYISELEQKIDDMHYEIIQAGEM